MLASCVFVFCFLSIIFFKLTAYMVNSYTGDVGLYIQPDHSVYFSFNFEPGGMCMDSDERVKVLNVLRHKTYYKT